LQKPEYVKSERDRRLKNAKILLMRKRA
jgi:hypothetical protein